jgi:hypothetical protein
MENEIFDPEPADKLGMTDEQWEIFQKFTRGYGDQDENGIDLSLLRENLKLTPSERLDRLQSAANALYEVDRARSTVSKSRRDA